MLDRQDVNIDFTNGVDKKYPDELGLPTRLLALDDALFDLMGNLNVRPGYVRQNITPMSGSNTPTAPNRVAVWKNSLLLEDLTQGWFRVHSLGAQSLKMDPTLVKADVSGVRTGYRANVSQRWVGGAAALGSNTTDFTFALGNGYRYFAWMDSTVRYRAESPDGAVILEGALYDTAGIVFYSVPRFVFDVFTSTAFLFYVKFNGAATYTLEVIGIPQSTMVASAASTLATITSAKTYDVYYGNALTAAWWDGTHLVQNILNDADASVRYSQNVTTAGTPAYVAVHSGVQGAFATKSHVAFHEGGTAVKCAYMGNNGAAGATATIGTASGAGASQYRMTLVDNGSKLYVVYDNVPTGAYVQTDVVKLRMVVVNETLTSVTKETDICGGYALQGRALYADGRFVVPVLFRDPTAPSFFLVDFTWHAASAPAASPWVPPHVVARLAWGEASDAKTYGPLPEVQHSAAHKMEFVFTRWSPTLDIVGATNVTARRMVHAALAIKANEAPLGSVEISDLLYLAGACPHVYDGSAVVEEAFNTRPIIRSVTLNSGGGGGLAAGSYSFVAVYEWIDRQGNLWLSAPSDPVAVTVTTENGFSASVSTLRSTQKAGVRVVIFRTTANGTSYYRDMDVANDTSTSSVTMTDSGTVLDTVLEQGTQLYTDGGRLENIPMPPCRQFAVHQRRLFVTGGGDDYEFWYSNQPDAKFAPGMSDVLRFSVSSSWGRLIGIGVVDDKLVLAAEDTAGVIFGDGPTASGDQNGYSEPSPILQKVAVKWGTPNAVMTTDQGMWFQTENGLRLLGRGMALVEDDNGPIGSEVDAFLVDANVTAVVQPPDEHHTYFFVETGIAVVYDRYYKQWSRLTNIDGGYSACLAYSPGTTDRSVFFVGGAYLNRGFEGTSDPAQSITPLAETAWVKMAGVQGFQRIRDVSLLAAGTVNVSLAADYGGYDDPATLAMGSALTNARFPAVKQKCEAMKVKITGFSTLRSLALQVGVKRGMVKLPYTKYA